MFPIAVDLFCTGFALQGICYVKVTNTLQSNIDSFVAVYNFYDRQTYTRTKPLLIWDIHIAWWNLINHSSTFRENFKGDIGWWGWAGGGENFKGDNDGWGWRKFSNEKWDYLVWGWVRTHTVHTYVCIAQYNTSQAPRLIGPFFPAIHPYWRWEGPLF